MDKAIITGATGLVGLSVTNYLISRGVDVLALGRKKLDSDQLNNLFTESITYLDVNMKDIDNLPLYLKDIKWDVGEECIFYNFAWGGINTLTDGDFSSQMQNAVNSSKAVRVAKEIGCKKYINLGTIQETICEDYLTNNYPKSHKISQLNYSLSKLASRDLSKINAYLNSIDYIHTRLSMPIDPSLANGTYFASSLKKILKNIDYQFPTNNQLFDVIFISDVAKAFYLIGEKGKNKADYYIGTGRPNTLKNYFEYFEDLVKNRNQLRNKFKFKKDNMFNNEILKSDTGFVSEKQFENIIDYHPES